MNVTKNLMIDPSNSTKDVVHFMIPKPVVMQNAEQANKSGHAARDGLKIRPYCQILTLEISTATLSILRTSEKPRMRTDCPSAVNRNGTYLLLHRLLANR